MKIHDERGFALSIIAIVLLFILLMASAGFGYWAFHSRNDYKNNVDQKISVATEKAQAAQKAKLDSDYAEKEKSPNKVYKGPLSYGTVNFNYPKSWSAYVDESNGPEPVNGYFHPDVVPSVQSPTAFALRVELVARDYSSTLREFDSQIKLGKVNAKAYIPPKMVNISNVTPGTRLDGTISRDSQGKDQQGSMIVIKVRDKTLKIYTESTSFLSDFDNIILATLTFIP